MVRRLIRAGLVALIAASVSSCAATVEPAPTVVDGTARWETVATWDPREKTLTYRGAGGKTVGKILFADARNRAVATGQDATLYVTAIRGVEARVSEHEFWALYINGEASTRGPGIAETNATDLVVWRLEKFK